MPLDLEGAALQRAPRGVQRQQRAPVEAPLKGQDPARLRVAAVGAAHRQRLLVGSRAPVDEAHMPKGRVARLEPPRELVCGPRPQARVLGHQRRPTNLPPSTYAATTGSSAKPATTVAVWLMASRTDMGSSSTDTNQGPRLRRRLGTPRLLARHAGGCVEALQPLLRDGAVVPLGNKRRSGRGVRTTSRCDSSCASCACWASSLSRASGPTVFRTKNS